jgi:predicted MFS family arabinose efflux permease
MITRGRWGKDVARKKLIPYNRRVLSRDLLLALVLGLAPGAAVGIGRFAYALVLPEMQLALGLSYAQAGLLGSANTGGYLVGALISHRVLYAVGYRLGLYLALALQVLTLLLLAFTESFALLFALRFAQGVLGAFAFVGGAALLLASGGKSLATALYFGGVGVGIALSPLALHYAANWQGAWQGLAALSAVLSALCLVIAGWLREPAPRLSGAAGSLRPIVPQLVAYGLYGAGYIGYMTFVTTALEIPLGPFWLLLGAGAMATGVVWGRYLERVGGERTLGHVLFVLACSSLYPLVVALPWLSAALFGVSFLGVVTAITVVFSRKLPAGAWARAMAMSTAAFALGQALGPSVSGLAADLVAGPVGALGASSLLLFLAYAVARCSDAVRR